MPRKQCSDSEFMELITKYGAAGTAKKLSIGVRSVFARRARIEQRLGCQIEVPDPRGTRDASDPPGRVEDTIQNGIVLIGSDAHFLPDYRSTAFRAFVEFCKNLKPQIVVLNGDILDFPSISRHDPIGWEKRPTVIQEIETAQERLKEIQEAAPKSRLYWPGGNHDLRLEARLALIAPEYANVHGMHLKDHFSPRWTPCWSLVVNGNVVVKHRFKGGIHAAHNNAVMSGMHIFTGHLHSLKITPWTDYTGTRYGVDTGTLADPFGPQFEYLEDNPRNWRSGFVVATFKDSMLLWPEIVAVVDKDRVQFRGELIQV